METDLGRCMKEPVQTPGILQFYAVDVFVPRLSLGGLFHPCVTQTVPSDKLLARQGRIGFDGNIMAVSRRSAP